MQTFKDKTFANGSSGNINFSNFQDNFWLVFLEHY